MDYSRGYGGKISYQPVHDVGGMPHHRPPPLAPQPPTTTTTAPPPRSIYELSKEAHDGLHFSPRYALTTWKKSAESLILKSNQHQAHSQTEVAFILMARAAVLYLEKIPSHPDYLELSTPSRSELRLEGEKCLQALTFLKGILVGDPRYGEASDLGSAPAPGHGQGHGGDGGYTPMALPVPPVPVRPSSVGDSSFPYPRYQPELTAPHASYSHATGQYYRAPSDSARPARDYQTTSSSHQDQLEREESLYLAEQRRKQEVEWEDHEYAKRLASDQEREERELVDKFQRVNGLGQVSAWSSISGGPPGVVPVQLPQIVGPSESRGYEGYTGQRHSMPPGGTYSGSSNSTVGAQTSMPDPWDYQRRRQEVEPRGYVPPMQPGQVYERGYGQSSNSHLYPYSQMQASPQVRTHPHTTMHPTSTAEDRRHSTPSSPRPRPPRSRDHRPLRPLHVPISLIPTFLRIASSHTRRGIEMCGLLLGTIRPPSARSRSKDPRYSRPGSGASSIAQSVLGHQEEEEGELVVQAVLIPRQEGTSDTCTMKEEERVVGVQLERGLIALGWIHTHPTQSCFMSSMDLHTHAAYQQTLPEAIAIVCAPRCDPSFGIFRLTEPAGLATVLQCKRMQTFHDHPKISGGLYTDADQGGHVWLNEHGRSIEVIDLRR